MVKTYQGHRSAQGVVVEVVQDGRPKRLKHVVYHSPTGFEWGYGGSGPADLALSILADFLGRKPEPWLYQAFKGDFVSKWDSRWVIHEGQIQDWLNEKQKGGGIDCDEMGELQANP